MARIDALLTILQLLPWMHILIIFDQVYQVSWRV
ncbi:unnamed protein product [Schistosoma mattheei]|uniref:Uncharacterized protein n=1 Tax=Schistosoma mattheei TaxID=31246 RepID=A0A3P8GZ52_9TREM|nr:unnamed protein product [Schistosoma mattheei]